jgi:hypothetical protein
VNEIVGNSRRRDEALKVIELGSLGIQPIFGSSMATSVLG